MQAQIHQNIDSVSTDFVCQLLIRKMCHLIPTLRLHSDVFRKMISTPNIRVAMNGVAFAIMRFQQWQYEPPDRMVAKIG